MNNPDDLTDIGNLGRGKEFAAPLFIPAGRYGGTGDGNAAVPQSRIVLIDVNRSGIASPFLFIPKE
jgi:hypothetical protein